MATGDVEGLPSELDYFEPSMYQSSILAEYDRDFNPLSTITQGAPIEFFIRGADNLYLDLNNSKYDIKLKVTKEDNSALTDATSVAPVNLLLHSLFSSAEMELGGKPITDPNSNYPYRSFIETIINYPHRVLETRMLGEGWTKDTSGKMSVTAPAGDNLGLKARGLWTGSSATIRLVGRPHFDLFHQDKLIPGNIDVKFRFIPNKANWLLKTAAPGDRETQVQYKVQILAVRLLIRTKEIAPSLAIAHERLLQTTNYKIAYNKVTTKTISIASGTTVFEQDNIYMGLLPDLVVLALIADADMAGGYQRNPFNFQNFDLNYLALKANGEQVPRLAHRPDFANKDYINSYIAVLSALGYDIGPNCWDLTPQEWANGYTIFAFKITPGPIGTIRSPPRTGSIRLELKFSSATGANINVLLLSQQPAELQIDKFKNIINSQ